MVGVGLVEIFGNIDQTVFFLARELRFVQCRRIILNGHRESLGKDAGAVNPVFRSCVSRGNSTILPVTHNVGAAAPLRHGILCCIDYTPFDDIAKLVEAFQDDCEVATTLFSRGKQQAVHILQKYYCRTVFSLLFENPVD